MPPFRLEKFKENRRDRINRRMLYAQNEYSEGVKISDWKLQLDQRPFDNDPFSKERVNHFLSHYKRLSLNDDVDFTTTTAEMSRNLSQIKKPSINKEVINYYTFSDNMLTSSGKHETTEFITTTQQDYKCPYPYPKKPITLPPIPLLQNRRLRNCVDNPALNDNKFHDDQFDEETRRLMRIKGARYVSYNPMTNDWN